VDAADPIPTPPPRLTEAEVHALAESALSSRMTVSRMTGSRVTGSRVTGLSPLAGSVGNQNFRLDGPGGPWAIKLGPAAEVAAEAWATGAVGAAGVAVPRIVADGALPERRRFLITAWLDGRPIRAGDRAALHRTGRTLRVLHGLGGPGYGPVDVVPDGSARGRRDGWAEALADLLAGLSDLVRHGLLTAGEADRVRHAVADHGGLTGYSGPGVLLHGDLKPAHLFVAGDALAAIIDWGDPWIGDPRWDLARLSMAGAGIFRPVLAGYGLDLDAELGRTLALYRAIWRVGSLHYELMASGDWFDAYRRPLLAWAAGGSG